MHMLRYTKWEDWSLTIINSVHCLFCMVFCSIYQICNQGVLSCPAWLNSTWPYQTWPFWPGSTWPYQTWPDSIWTDSNFEHRTADLPDVLQDFLRHGIPCHGYRILKDAEDQLGSPMGHWNFTCWHIVLENKQTTEIYNRNKNYVLFSFKYFYVFHVSTEGKLVDT